MKNNNIEERLYKCFEEVFKEYDGQLNVDLDCSNTVSDSAGYACSGEFLEEMYKRYRKENPEIPPYKETLIDENNIERIIYREIGNGLGHGMIEERNKRITTFWHDLNSKETEVIKVFKKWLSEGRVKIIPKSRN